MKRNKQLLNIARRDRERIRNDSLLESLLKEQEKNKAEGRVKKPFYVLMQFKTVCVGVACIVVSLIILLCVVFIKPNGNVNAPDNATDNKQNAEASQPPHFSTDVGPAIIRVTNEELFDALVGSGITILDNFDFTVNRMYDRTSGEIFCYTIIIDDEEAIIACDIKIITNPTYEPTSQGTNTTESILGKTFDINSDSFYDEAGGIYIHAVYAETEVNGIRIIFRDYSAITASEENGFKEFVESMFLFS